MRKAKLFDMKYLFKAEPTDAWNLSYERNLNITFIPILLSQIILLNKNIIEKSPYTHVTVRSAPLNAQRRVLTSEF